MIRNNIEVFNYSLHRASSGSWVRDKYKYVPYNCSLIKDSDLKAVLNFTSSRSKKKLDSEDVIYFCPSSSISRTKFRAWARSNTNIRITYNPAQATVIVFDSKILKEFNQVTSSHDKDYDNLTRRFYKLRRNSDLLFADVGGYSGTGVNFNGALDSFDGDKYWWRYKTDNSMVYVETDEDPNDSSVSSYICIDNNNDKYFRDNFDEVLSTIYHVDLSKAYYMDEADITNNTNSLSMDESAFIMCKNMLNSGDEDNIVTAIEMCTNYDAESSKIYLGLLKMLCYEFKERLRYKSKLPKNWQMLYKFNKERLHGINFAGKSSYNNPVSTIDKFYQNFFREEDKTHEAAKLLERTMTLLFNELFTYIKLEHIYLNRKALGFKNPKEVIIKEETHDNIHTS